MLVSTNAASARPGAWHVHVRYQDLPCARSSASFDDIEVLTVSLATSTKGAIVLPERTSQGGALRPCQPGRVYPCGPCPRALARSDDMAAVSSRPSGVGAARVSRPADLVLENEVRRWLAVVRAVLLHELTQADALISHRRAVSVPNMQTRQTPFYADASWGPILRASAR